MCCIHGTEVGALCNSTYFLEEVSSTVSDKSVHLCHPHTVKSRCGQSGLGPLRDQSTRIRARMDKGNLMPNKLRKPGGQSKCKTQGQVKPKSWKIIQRAKSRSRGDCCREAEQGRSRPGAAHRQISREGLLHLILLSSKPNLHLYVQMCCQ